MARGLSKIRDKVSPTRSTPTHRQQLKTALLNDSLTEEDQTAINRLLHAVRRGWLKVVD